MQSPTNSDAPEPRRDPEEHDAFWKQALLCAVGAIALLILFYAEENWRGRRAWEACKRELNSRGAVMEWSNYIPPPVPNEQNFFKAPNMAAWFAGRTSSSLSGRLSITGFYCRQESNTAPIAEVTIVAPDASIAAGTNDLILDYRNSAVSVGSKDPPKENQPGPVIPLIAMDEVPLGDAIERLAKAADLKYTMDPAVLYDAGIGAQPKVSFSWTNITAREALFAVLNDHQLRWIPDDKTGVARIRKGPLNYRNLLRDAKAEAALKSLLEDARFNITNGFGGRETLAFQDFALFARSAGQPATRHIFVRAAKVPETNEVAAFFPETPLFPGLINPRRIEVVAGDSNAFRVWFSPPPAALARDYLAWSDQFESDFDQVREALKRPYARIDWNYQSPGNMQIPNFITIRYVAQTLGQRAQCHLLLGQSAAALDELTLIHDLCRILEAPPSGKPITVVAAMINVAVTRIYVDAISDGLRVNGWREPELAALQSQLAGIDLARQLRAGLEMERVSVTKILETITPEGYRNAVTGGTSTNLWDKLGDPAFLFLELAPRGWIYQNMVTISQQQDEMIGSIDLTNAVVLPAVVRRATTETFERFHRYDPNTLLAAQVAPNFTKAVQVMSRTQTWVNEALVVCALERYRLAHGRYPETLEALKPEFLGAIPHDLIGGGALKYHAADGRFLLYSIGWNEKDDGGVMTIKPEGRIDAEDDWVWPYHQRLPW